MLSINPFRQLTAPKKEYKKVSVRKALGEEPFPSKRECNSGLVLCISDCCPHNFPKLNFLTYAQVLLHWFANFFFHNIYDF